MTQYLYKTYFILQITGLFCLNAVKAQTGPAERSLPPAKRIHAAGYPPDKDMGDVLRSSKKKAAAKQYPDTSIHLQAYHYSLVPAVGYTLQTGFAGILSANLAYHNDTGATGKLSSISTSITYSQYNQTIIPLLADIWTKGNKINLVSDNRFIAYPSDVYGLGGKSDPNKGVTINFSGLKLHETILRSVSKNLYLGMGIYVDKFWGIEAIDSIPKRINLRVNKELGTSENASGIAVKALYDSRLNQINPENGLYCNVVYRSDFTFLGSDNNWQSLLIDARTYTHFPRDSKNILAFWNLDWITTGGTPPYLLLPSTGWDDQYNTGRGYIQGRFRGKRMLYAESEYRYRISANGLLGGVLFVNMQNFSSDISSQFNGLIPGYGLGFRLKLNKHSGANLCVDYGFGRDGSRGFFVNLGEVF